MIFLLIGILKLYFFTKLFSLNNQNAFHIDLDFIDESECDLHSFFGAYIVYGISFHNKYGLAQKHEPFILDLDERFR